MSESPLRNGRECGADARGAAAGSRRARSRPRTRRRSGSPRPVMRSISPIESSGYVSPPHPCHHERRLTPRTFPTQDIFPEYAGPEMKDLPDMGLPKSVSPPSHPAFPIPDIPFPSADHPFLGNGRRRAPRRLHHQPQNPILIRLTHAHRQTS